jgi:hypothetical protein
MKGSRKRGQGSSWTVAHAEEEEENKIYIVETEPTSSLNILKETGSVHSSGERVAGRYSVVSVRWR